MLDLVKHFATLGLETGVLLRQQCIDLAGRFCSCLVEFIDIGADCDEAEALRGFSVLAGVVGNGGGGG